MAKAISFARGAPSLDIVDVDGLKAAAERAFTNDPAGVTAYGTSIGYPPLRELIAERHQVEPSRVLVTNGSMQADAFLFDALIEPGDSVIVERPTYDRTLLALRNRGADVRAVELEHDGIDVAAVERVLAAGARPKLAHIIPTFQNPAGYTLSADKRQRLVELARAHEFMVFEDDPYVALRFKGSPVATMLSTDGERVTYASSFSKTVCPGIRVGYLVGPEELIARIAKIATSTYISPSMVSQGIVYEFSRSGALERSIETVKQALAERAKTLCETLRNELPDWRFQEPEGGYFLWVELPRGTDVGALFEAAAERGVQFVKGSDFVLEGGDSSLRLAYSGVTPAEIEEGVKRLAEAYREVTAGTASAVPATSAPVALAPEHQLLGERDPRRRRGVGDHRHGLGDARGDGRHLAVGHDGHVLAVVGGDLALQPGLDARALEVVQEILGLVLEPQDRHLGAWLAVCQRDSVDPLPDPDRMAVRTRLGVPHGGADVRLEPRRHRVLELLRLLVDVIPRNADDIGEEPLDHPVAADDRLGVLAPGGGEVDRPPGVTNDVPVALEPSEHLVHGRRRQLHRPRQVGAGHRQARLEQPEQRLEVLLFGYCRMLAGHVVIVAIGPARSVTIAAC